MAQTLHLTDGVTTLNLIDGTNYAVADTGWQPSVAPAASLSQNYYDVLTETLTIYVLGSTAAQVYQNVTALMQLLQQAERWAEQLTTENAVRLRYQPAGSGQSAALECLCLGRAGTDQDMDLGVYDDTGIQKVATVTIKLARRALWLTPTTQSGTVTTNPSASWVPYTVTFPAASPAPGPTSLSLALTNGPYTTFGGSQYLAIAASGDITMVSAGPTLTDGTNFVALTSSAFPAVGTTVMRFIQPAGSPQPVGPNLKSWTVPTGAPTNVYDIFLSGRADTTPATLWIMPSSQAGVTSPDTTQALLSFVLPASTTVGSMYAGRIILPGNGSTTTLGIAMQGTNPNMALIDRIACIRQTPETAIVQTTLASNGPALLGGPVSYTMNPLTALLPSSNLGGMTGTTALLTRGTQLQVLWMANDTSTTGGYTMTASATVGGTKAQATWTLTATRNRAYLIPE